MRYPTTFPSGPARNSIRRLLPCLTILFFFLASILPAQARRIAPLGSYNETLGLVPSGDPEADAARRASRARIKAKLKDELGLSDSEQPASSAGLIDGGSRRGASKAAFRGPIHPLDLAWRPLIDRLVIDGFDREKMEALFISLGPRSYSPAYMATKITELYGVGGIGINRENGAAPAMPEDYEQPVSDVTVGSCMEFMKKYAFDLAAIEDKHGVPARVIIAILLVETGLGLDLGSDTSLRALASMAATTTPAMLGGRGNASQANRVRTSSLAATLRDKSNWAYNEVKALIRYGEQCGTDPARIPGSFYGAIGICQFMPSNIDPYGVDGDKDGKVDVFSVVDAMYSVANYLEANGWRGAKSSAQQFAVIRTYNQDNIYAARVLGISNYIGRAVAGKVPAGRSAMAGIGPVPSGALDPSLKRGRRGARMPGLGSYEGLLQY